MKRLLLLFLLVGTLVAVTGTPSRANGTFNTLLALAFPRADAPTEPPCTTLPHLCTLSAALLISCKFSYILDMEPQASVHNIVLQADQNPQTALPPYLRSFSSSTNRLQSDSEDETSS